MQLNPTVCDAVARTLVDQARRMNLASKRNILILVGILFVAALVAGWLAFQAGRGPEAAPKTQTQTAASSNAKTPSPFRHTDAEETGDPLKRITLERFGALIDTATPAEMAAMFELTNDYRFWAGLHDLPGLPPVALMSLALGSHDEKEAIAWAKSWCEADPDNAAAFLALATGHARQGDENLTLESLKQALSKPGMNLYSQQRLAEANSLLRKIGAAPDELALVKARVNDDRCVGQMQKLGDFLAKKQEQLLSGGQMDAAVEIASCGAGLATAASRLVGASSGFDSIFQANEMRLLKALPPETLYREGGETVSDRIRFLNDERLETIRIGNQVPAWLESASIEQRKSWEERREAFGAREANRWLGKELGHLK